MKRFFLIFLLVLLPFQFSWAVAATYCAHEETSSAPHFGHHVHNHETTDGGAKEKTSSIKADTDCDYCHHVPASAIVPATPGLTQPELTVHARLEVQRYPSHISDLIPRPDWPALA